MTSLKFATYNTDWTSEAYITVSGQNSNNSLRVTNGFMEAVEKKASWNLYWRTEKAKAEKDGREPKPCKTLDASQLWDDISYAAWSCADPGLQYDTTINEWHTCPESGRINASYPCSEYMFLDNTACNLASINLLRYLRPDGSFDVEGYVHACEITITAQEIIVDNASYPTEKIGENSHLYRPLGLGYANLGALLMALGLSYDSDAGRAWCGALTAIMTGAAYRKSAEVAAHLGPFQGYHRNRESMLDVIQMHRDAVEDIHLHPALPFTVRMGVQFAF